MKTWDYRLRCRAIRRRRPTRSTPFAGIDKPFTDTVIRRGIHYSSGVTFTHAGGIVVRGDHPPRLLLVRAKPAPHDWVLPKGHIDPGETPEQTARREVIEEAGVEADVVRYVDLIEFDSPRGEHGRCAYYLMQFVREVPADEEREIRWASLDDALRLIEFDNTRSLIRVALSDRR